MQSVDKSARLAALDGLRGLAALAVVLLHGNEIFILPWVPKNAYLAVDFFFLLSGYVLARSFDDGLRRGGAGEFLRRRMLRLYPLIVAGSLIGLTVLVLRSLMAHALGPAEVVVDFVCSLLLLPSPPWFGRGWNMYPDDPPLWSLFYELTVNVVYALAAPWLTTKRLIAFTGVIGLGLAAAILWFHNADFALDHFAFGALRVLFSFSAGILFHRLEAAAKAQAALQRLGGLARLAQPLAFVGLGLVLFSPAGLSAAYALVAIFVVFPLVLTASLAAPALGRRAERLCLVLGVISYPLYVLHHPSFRLISGTFFHASPLRVRMAAMAASFVAVVIGSYLADRIYDQPVRKWLTRVTSRRTGGPVARSAPVVT